MRTRTPLIAALAVGALLAGTPAAVAAEPAPPAASAVDTIATRIDAAAERGVRDADGLGDAAGLPDDGPGSLRFGEDGRLSATVTFAHAPTAQQLDAVGAIARIDRVFTVAPAIAVMVDPAFLVELGEIDGVVSADPDLAPMVAGTTGEGARAAAAAAGHPCRSIPVDGDTVIRAAQARGRFGVDGTGVTVGVISSSFGLVTSRTSPQQDVEAGLLPGPGNPCGYKTPVEVIYDDPQDATDEGRAMAQLVHGIAPGAGIAFASAGRSPIAMAQSITDLADAGATVIVDDIGWAEETFFQRGILGHAIDEVRSRGVAYYTAAGNDNVVGDPGLPSAGKPISSWQTPAYRPTACPSWVAAPAGATSYDCLDFDPSGGGDPADTVGFNGRTRANPAFLLSWGEPLAGVVSSFEVRVYDTAPVPALLGTGTRIAKGVPNAIVSPDRTQPAGDYRVVVVRDTTDGAPPAPAVWLGAFGNASGLSWRQHDQDAGPDVVGPAALGHSVDGSAVSVAAVGWNEFPAPERFSSFGPGTLLFAPFDPDAAEPAPRLPAPVTVDAPHIAGLDGQTTSFFGRPAGTAFRFFGTSAAAPTAAAVHALAASYAPSVPADAIIAAMVATAQPLSNPYAPHFADHDVFGAGLADAEALLAALPAPVPPRPSTLPATGSAGGLGPFALLGAGGILLGVALLLARRRVRRLGR